ADHFEVCGERLGREGEAGSLEIRLIKWVTRRPNWARRIVNQDTFSIVLGGLVEKDPVIWRSGTSARPGAEVEGDLIRLNRPGRLVHVGLDPHHVDAGLGTIENTVGRVAQEVIEPADHQRV